MKFEYTMLAKLVSAKWKSKKSEAAIFIDRDGERFKYILDFYRDGEILVPKTVALEVIKNDAMYFGLPEDVSIKEVKKELSLKDIGTLWDTLETMKCQSIADISATQHFNAALWVVERFLKFSCTSKSTRQFDLQGNPVVGISMEGYKDLIPAIKDARKLIPAIKDIISSLENSVLCPTLMSITAPNRCLERFTIEK